MEWFTTITKNGGYFIYFTDFIFVQVGVFNGSADFRGFRQYEINNPQALAKACTGGQPMV